MLLWFYFIFLSVFNFNVLYLHKTHMNSTEYVISSDPNWLSGISKSHRYSLNLRPTKNEIGNQVFLCKKLNSWRL